MADTSQELDIGTKIILDCVEDISASTAWKIKYKKQDGTSGEWVAGLESTTSISYVTTADDLDQDGNWCLQSYIVMPNWTGHGEVVKYVVKRNV